MTRFRPLLLFIAVLLIIAAICSGNYSQDSFFTLDGMDPYAPKIYGHTLENGSNAGGNSWLIPSQILL